MPGGTWREVALPKAPYKIEAGDLLFIDAAGTILDQPIHGFIWLADGNRRVRAVIRARQSRRGDAEKGITGDKEEVTRSRGEASGFSVACQWWAMT